MEIGSRFESRGLNLLSSKKFAGSAVVTAMLPRLQKANPQLKCLGMVSKRYVLTGCHGEQETVTAVKVSQ